MCGRNLSIQRSKGQYEYFFCLGQKDRRKPETFWRPMSSPATPRMATSEPSRRAAW
ncbi:MAG TPA: hypothetical protein VN193_02610 [Candidatus Angelobacter sp.]|nr:hypothetical protein [Candidatus Angelobacter sp.]